MKRRLDLYSYFHAINQVTQRLYYSTFDYSDAVTSRELKAAFQHFDQDSSLSAAVFTGAGGNFCAGYDLQFLAKSESSEGMQDSHHLSSGPMGPTHLQLSKPVIAAVEGYAVAGKPCLAVHSCTVHFFYVLYCDDCDSLCCMEWDGTVSMMLLVT